MVVDGEDVEETLLEGDTMPLLSLPTTTHAPICLAIELYLDDMGVRDFLDDAYKATSLYSNSF